MLEHVKFTPENDEQVRHHVFTMEDAYRSPLMRQFFQLRKRVFIQGMGWDLPTTDLGEVDQYDRKNAHYVISEKNGDIVGGMRLIPTTNAFFDAEGRRSTYMIKDAYDGRLPNMPRDLIASTPPVDKSIWEVTRVITAKEPHNLKSLIGAACRFLVTKNAKHILYHTRPSASRLGKIWGYEVAAMGPSVAIGGINFQVNKVTVK